MPDTIPTVETEFANREQDFGLRRLRLGCVLAAVLTPPGALIDLMMFRFPENTSVPLEHLFAFRVLCSAGVVPIFLLSYQPFAARYFRLLGVALAFAPAFCMAGSRVGAIAKSISRDQRISTAAGSRMGLFDMCALHGFGADTGGSL